MDINFDELKDWNDSARRELTYEADRLKTKFEQISNYLRTLEVTDELIAKIDDLNEKLNDKQTLIDRQTEELKKMQTEYDNLHEQLHEEKEQRTKVEMQLKEMSQLSAGVAKKASQDELLKAIRVFVNKSKRKKIEKRIAVKEMVLEMANANGIVLPEDLAATIDALDDEQPDPKVVHVAGSYNDIHDNTNVNTKE